MFFIILNTLLILFAVYLIVEVITGNPKDYFYYDKETGEIKEKKKKVLTTVLPYLVFVAFFSLIVQGVF